ncbi:hypothetical protein [Streptomyces sp. NPDC059631]|uniref:hypothetical protein n=1 Tax=unclassified Streptomyces TaxID=2593676 RepID=UPI0036CAEDA9
MPTSTHIAFAVVCLMLAASQAARSEWCWTVAALVMCAGHLLAIAQERTRRKYARAWAAAARQAAEGFARGMQQAQQRAARKEQP